LAAEIEQNLRTESDGKLVAEIEQLFCCFYRYLNCDVIATEKSSKITFSILFIFKTITLNIISKN